MRIILFTLLIFFASFYEGNSQILKQIGEQAKQRMKARAEQKANETIDKAIDSLMAKPKKKEKNNPTEGNTQKENKQDKANAQTTNATKESEGDMEPKDGYIQAEIAPSQTLIGAPLLITGGTMVSDKFKEITIEITPPAGAKEKVTYRTPINSIDGTFKFHVLNTNSEGEYKVTVNSPDGKASKKLTFTIYDFDGLDDIGEKIKDLMEEASKNLKAIVEKMKDQAASKDDKEIDIKMKEVEDNIAAGEKMLTSINEACGKFGKAAKEGKGMPDNVRKNLGALNDIFQKQEVVMKEQIERTKHKPADNTICEYMVMLNEACAAFSTFTNVYSKSIITILKNVSIDKGIPKGVETANKKAPNGVSADNDFWVKEPAKITATALLDAGSFSDKLGKAGIAGDLLQYASGVLLKKYCGTFSGELQYHYENIYSNEGENWWKYTYDCGATVSLRYPKSQTGKVIKMKGNIEGNATGFTFGYDVKHFLPRNIIIYAQRAIKPAAVPFVSSQHDDLGFGMAARAVGTPAYFNLTVDAEYNTETENITLFYNDALVDFSPAVSNRGLIMIIAAGIPIIKFVDFPINKMGKSFGATLKRNPEFKVVSGGTAFSGSGKMSIGENSSIEHKANFTLSAKKD